MPYVFKDPYLQKLTLFGYSFLLLTKPARIIDKSQETSTESHSATPVFLINLGRHQQKVIQVFQIIKLSLPRHCSMRLFKVGRSHKRCCTDYPHPKYSYITITHTFGHAVEALSIPVQKITRYVFFLAN